MAFDKKLLDILACPSCKGALLFDDQTNELLCRFDKLAFPIRDNIPVMLIDEARQLNQGETP